MIVSFLSSQRYILFSRQKLQLPYQVFDYLIPKELFRCTTTSAANTLLLFRITTQMQQVTNNFIGIIGFSDNGILERDGIILASGTSHGDTFCRHDFECDEPKGFMSTVCQGRICGIVDGTHKFFGKEEAQVIDISRTSIRHEVQALLQVRSPGFDIPTHKNCDGVPTILQASRSFNRHHPAFVRIEATNFEEEQATRVSLVSNLLQACDSILVNRSEVACGNAIWNDERVDSVTPHPVHHVLTDRTNPGDEVEAPLIDTVQ